MDFDHPPADPVLELSRWLDRAARETKLPNPSAMTLATIASDGRPTARIVLLKGLDARGIVFFTNLDSPKCEALTSNDRVALVFHWDAIALQVRIEGRATPIEDAESDAYFATRPRGSQIGAWASDQSRPISDRAALETKVRDVEERFADADIPRPPNWGGYRVSLDKIEFWHGLTDRLHDRLCYCSDGNGGWTVERLEP